MMMTPVLQNVDCIVRHFLVGSVCAIKLNLKLTSATGTVWALMTLQRAIMIPISANGYEELDKIFLPYDRS